MLLASEPQLSQHCAWMLSIAQTRTQASAQGKISAKGGVRRREKRSEIKTSVVVQTYNPRTWGAMAERSEFKGQLWLQSKLEASLSYKRTLLKKRRKRKTAGSTQILQPYLHTHARAGGSCRLPRLVSRRAVSPLTGPPSLNQ